MLHMDTAGVASKVVRANQNIGSSSSEETPQDSIVNTAVPGQCLELCCKDVRTGPNQLVEPSLLDKMKTLYGSDKNKKERSFRSNWY